MISHFGHICHHHIWIILVIAIFHETAHLVTFSTKFIIDLRLEIFFLFFFHFNIKIIIVCKGSTNEFVMTRQEWPLNDPWMTQSLNVMLLISMFRHFSIKYSRSNFFTQFSRIRITDFATFQNQIFFFLNFTWRFPLSCFSSWCTGWCFCSLCCTASSAGDVGLVDFSIYHFNSALYIRLVLWE